MGSSKKHQKNVRPPTQLRSRQTRSKGKLLSDPAQNTQLLTEQLRSLGLYAAPTLGDGNCLFRALSDQLYGTPSHHLQLRKDICDWIETHKSRYEPFCEDERGLDAHLRCMREPATYGGHLELSAFAHLTRRNVKVIQPGLVYVIEWNTGGDAPPDQPESSSSSMSPQPEDLSLNERERRRRRRDEKRAEAQKAVEVNDSDDEVDSSVGAVYVAYHDWEHFSSIRNLKGPHAGLPSVSETRERSQSPPIAAPAKKKPYAKAKSKGPGKHTGTSRSKPGSAATAPISTSSIATGPSEIPLPDSRTPSPSPSIEVDIIPPSPLPPASAYNMILTHPSNSDMTTPPPSAVPTLASLRVHRSPKRSFDESSGSSACSDGAAKRTRSNLSATSTRRLILDDDPEHDLDSTPGLSAPGSSASSSAASSPLSSPPPPPVEKPLTRRQRKAAGLPKPRTALVGKASASRSAGKIVIPGGRFKKANVRGADDEDEEGGENEWRRNGAGRLDVRGFRELKI